MKENQGKHTATNPHHHTVNKSKNKGKLKRNKIKKKKLAVICWHLKLIYYCN